MLRTLIRSHLSDVEALIFRCTCRHARELVLTTKGKEKILDYCTEKLYSYAATIGSSSLLDWLYEYQKIPLHQYQVSPISVAAFSGKNPEIVLKWLVSKGANLDHEEVAGAAAHHGDKQLLIWVSFTAGIKLNTRSIVSEAVRGGHADLVRWLIEEERAPCDDFLCAAANIGHVELLKFFILKPGNLLTSTVLENAARSGSIEAIEWVRAQKTFPWVTRITTAAANAGHMRALQWLINQGCPVNEHATVMCAAGGHLDILKYLHKPPLNIPIPSYSVTKAAHGGHLQMLRYLVESCGCFSGNQYACAQAATARSLPCLQYLRECNFYWDAWTCALASLAGALELLQWAHDNGCPLNGDQCMMAAAEGGHVRIVAYLHETLQLPFPLHIRDIAADKLNVRLLRWLDAHNAPPQLRRQKGDTIIPSLKVKLKEKQQCAIC